MSMAGRVMAMEIMTTMARAATMDVAMAMATMLPMAPWPRTWKTTSVPIKLNLWTSTVQAGPKLKDALGNSWLNVQF